MIPFIIPRDGLTINLANVVKIVDHRPLASAAAGTNDFVEVYMCDGSTMEFDGQAANIVRGVSMLWAAQFTGFTNQLAGAGQRIVTPGS